MHRSQDSLSVAQKHAAELQDVKDKAKAFIKRKIEQLTQEHSAALALCAQQLSEVTAARNLAEQERDDMVLQCDALREELRAAAAAINLHSSESHIKSEDEIASQTSEELIIARAEIAKIKEELAISHRNMSDAIDAAAAADMFRQKQLEVEKDRSAAELQAERKRFECSLADAEAKFSAALIEARTATVPSDLNLSTSNSETEALRSKLQEAQAAADAAAVAASASEIQIQELLSKIGSLEYSAQVCGASADAVTSRVADAIAENEHLRAQISELKLELAIVPELKMKVAQLSSDAQSAAVLSASSDEKLLSAAETIRITTERNFQLERESRELLQVLQEKDAMLVRSADELVAVKSQAKAAGIKFSERSKSEKAALQSEIMKLQETLALRDEELRVALGAKDAEGNEATRAQAELESLKSQCTTLKEEAVAAVQGRNAIKSEYDTYKKRVQSVLAEQDSQYNRTIELERLLQVSAAAVESKSRDLQRALARISEMEAISSQETNALHSMRQQLTEAVNARDIARVREQAAEVRAATAESTLLNFEAASAESSGVLADQIRSLQSSLNLIEQERAHLQMLLQQKEAEFTENMRSASVEIAQLSTTVLELQRALSVSTLQLENSQVSCKIASTDTSSAPVDGGSQAEIGQKLSDAHSTLASAAHVSKQRYPQPSLEILLSTPSLPQAMPIARVLPSSSPFKKDADTQQLQLYIVALEQQVSTLRDALQDLQEQCSLFEKQCDWFKKKELELQLSQDRNKSASDLDYLRSVVVSYMESHDPAVIPAIAQALKMSKTEAQRLQGKHRGFLGSLWS